MSVLNKLPGSPKWTFDHDEALKRLVGASYSFSVAAAQINADFGTVYSRNAAIGRAHRLGLSSPMPPEIRKQRKEAHSARVVINQRARRAAASGKKMVSVEPTPELPDEIFAPAFQGRLDTPFALLSMFRHDASNQCRYIEPADCGPVFLACGNETEPGCAWCGHHMAIVHAPRERRRFKVVGNRRGVRASNFSGSFEAA